MTAWFIQYVFLIGALKIILNGKGWIDFTVGALFLAVAAAIRNAINEEIGQ
jgi:hypothetical protein